MPPPSHPEEVWIVQTKIWRRGWDLNPRWTCAHNGLAGRPIKPLSNLSDVMTQRI